MVGCCVSEAREPTDEELEDGFVQMVNNEAVMSLHNTIPNNELRKTCYQMFIRIWMGPMGKHNRVKLPDCVTLGVHKMYPSPNGVYMGYHDN